MLYFYTDTIFYVGEMKNGKRNGEGVLYDFHDYFNANKIVGNWVDDKLEGEVKTYTSSSFEFAHYKNGVKDGVSYRYYLDKANIIYITYYKNGLVQGKEVSRKFNAENKPIKHFNRVHDEENVENKDIYYVGDTYHKYPNGYGMFIKCVKNNIIYGEKIIVYADESGIDVLKKIKRNSTFEKDL